MRCGGTHTVEDWTECAQTQADKSENGIFASFTPFTWQIPLSLSFQSSAVEQVLDILMDILSWEIAEVVSPCLPRSL